jgi:hypothetical protein
VKTCEPTSVTCVGHLSRVVAGHFKACRIITKVYGLRDETLCNKTFLVFAVTVFENLLKKFKFCQNPTRMTVTNLYVRRESLVVMRSKPC